MDIEKIKEIIAAKPNLATALGIEFISTPDTDSCVARMTVDERTCQPFGLLSGGASLALAEELAGVASTALRPDKCAVGINVSANHIKAAAMGDIVTATTTIINAGKTLHTWKVEIRNRAGELISTATVTNYLIEKKTPH